MNKKAVFFDADGTVCDIKKEFRTAQSEQSLNWWRTDMKRGYVPEGAGPLFPGIWSRSLLPE